MIYICDKVLDNKYMLFILFGAMMQAVQAMVQQAMQYIDKTPDLDSKIELIKTLNNVSAGKVIIVLDVFFIFPNPIF